MNEGVRNDGSLAVNGRTTRNIASVHDEATISAIAVTGPKAGDLPGGLAKLLVWPPPFEAKAGEPESGELVQKEVAQSMSSCQPGFSRARQ